MSRVSESFDERHRGRAKKWIWFKLNQIGFTGRCFVLVLVKLIWFIVGKVVDMYGGSMSLQLRHWL